jgi:pyruvate/2-oxoglutarate dehydrogenase complex dihydrolipoamide dehydrogenase (E3) component
MAQYDVIVIGSGQSGGPVATDFAKAGHTVAMVEREHVGGTCVNVGCTPTKTMVASARVAYLARRGADYGVQTGDISVDLEKVRQRKRDIVASFRGGGERRLDEAHVTLIRGEACFVDPHTIMVNGEQHRADRIFINTGARTIIPNIPGLDPDKALTSTTIMELAEVPDHLVIIGGSYIALEFGQMFRRFGAKVTVIEQAELFLSREDRDVADTMRDILTEDGIDIHLNTKVERVEHTDSGVTLTVSAGGASKTISGSHLLLAVGRAPNTDALNLSAAGVNVDGRGYIMVNDRLETSTPHIWALGDVKGGAAFTHISYDDYRIVRENLMNGGSRTIHDRPTPYTMFTDPELAHVGMNETAARKAGKNIKVAKMPMAYVARARESDETRGMMKAVVDADTNQIIGFTILGVLGGELMTVVQMAMMGKLPYTVLKDAVFAHPTFAESLNNLFSTLE